MNLGDKLPVKAFENVTFFENNELLNEIRKKPTKTNTPTVNINIQSIQPVAPPAPVIQPVPVPVVQPIAIEQQPPPLHTVTRPTSEPPCCPFSCCCF